MTMMGVGDLLILSLIHQPMWILRAILQADPMDSDIWQTLLWNHPPHLYPNIPLP